MDEIHPHVSQILISNDEIQKRVKELGENITDDYKNDEIVMVCILKGAFLFMADLCRFIKIPINTEFMAISSYGHSTVSSGVVRILKDLNESIANKNVLIVEDIVDTGLTITYLAGIFAGRNPKSIKMCALCNKPQCHVKQVKIDYRGFDLPNEFVVGYGLDFKDYYRNLPYIGVLKPEIYTA